MKDILQEYMPAVITVIVFLLLFAIFKSTTVQDVIKDAFTGLITDSLDVSSWSPSIS